MPPAIIGAGIAAPRPSARLLLGASASKKAAKAQQASDAAAIAEERRQFDLIAFRSRTVARQLAGQGDRAGLRHAPARLRLYRLTRLPVPPW
jgi:hypothetical protein